MRLLKLLTCIIFGGVVGGATVWIFQGHSLRVKPEGIGYPDLIAVLLTGVSLVVAIFGVFLAAAALWGYTQFRRIVKDKTQKAVSDITPALVSQELKDGNTKQVLIGLIADLFRNELLKPGVAAAWAKEREEQKTKLQELDQDQDS